MISFIFAGAAAELWSLSRSVTSPQSGGWIVVIVGNSDRVSSQPAGTYKPPETRGSAVPIHTVEAKSSGTSDNPFLLRAFRFSALQKRPVLGDLCDVVAEWRQYRC